MSCRQYYCLDQCGQKYWLSSANWRKNAYMVSGNQFMVEFSDLPVNKENSGFLLIQLQVIQKLNQGTGLRQFDLEEISGPET